jgi:urease accessory protein
MLVFTTLLDRTAAKAATLELPLTSNQRRRARLRVTLHDGTTVGLMLDRGLALKDGDCLGSEDGRVVARIKAATEHLSRVSSADPHLLARAAYHLGNRHVSLELYPGHLSYPHDHVLDGMCRELGLEVMEVSAPFEPETGGYGHGHGHSHDHDHDHGHENVLLPHRHSHD